MQDICAMNKVELTQLIAQNPDGPSRGILAASAKLRRDNYGDGVFLRGLIEFTNYCHSNCYYCGIRRDNKTVRRYRLSREEILSCCESGYALGFRTFVLQGGEDPYFNTEKIRRLIWDIKSRYPDCALTLSIGERPRADYKAFRDAGADRYLLRHETANDAHYGKLHPPELSGRRRRECLYTLKELGFAVGAGFMVGSPFQTEEKLAEDLLFLKELQPDMVGIGPFIPHADTPFGSYPQGSLEQTLLMVSLARILLPGALLPATTALGTIHPTGREQGLLAGANVVMPNLSPVHVRKDYSLYNNKICTGEEAGECRGCLERRVNSAGFRLDLSRGDPARMEERP